MNQSELLLDCSTSSQPMGESRLEHAIHDAAIQKADTLIEALGWIRRFRDRVTVIKLGGSVLEQPDAMRHVLLDILFMESVGMRPVVVHGGGKRISRAMDEAGIEARFVMGRRYTDEQTLAIVERSLAGETNAEIVSMFEQLEGCPCPLTFATTNVLFGERLHLPGEDGNPLDLGFVGHVTQVDAKKIAAVCDAGQVPFIPSMCIDDQGQKLNVNADTAATMVAQAMQAEKLVFLSDVVGVLRDRHDPASLIHSLNPEIARQLIAEGVIESGMIPKVEACLETLAQGVGKVHIVDGRLRHSLLLEIYTTSGVGTQIVPR